MLDPSNKQLASFCLFVSKSPRAGELNRVLLLRANPFRNHKTGIDLPRPHKGIEPRDQLQVMLAAQPNSFIAQGGGKRRAGQLDYVDQTDHKLQNVRYTSNGATSRRSTLLQRQKSRGPDRQLGACYTYFNEKSGHEVSAVAGLT